MKPLFSLLALLSTLSLSQAQTYIATLDGAQDGGGLRQGSGTVTITLTGTTLTLSGSYVGLTAPSTAAHIHAAGLPGVNVGVLYDLGTPGIVALGSTAGSINGTVNMVDNANNRGFTVAQQLGQLNSGQWYVNIHNNSFPGGEIRGQIMLVPEPATWALGGLGLLGLLAWRRRK